MKKLALLALTALALTGCATNNQSATESSSSSAASSSQVVESNITVSVTQDGKAIENSPFELSFKEGDKLLDVMKAQMDIKEENGLVTSINGVEQQPDEQKYWLFDVNGQMSDKGAQDVELKDGDKIDWKLEAYQGE
ncbi:DUF4430 domain-containing protein [Streptococcus sp. NLN64]|uniref:DUF4430 domain-containing protein n=1 Tax=Streptococcus sp. NLN64 TaxID=2822799 RepID=UPI0018CAC39D|nr:DUF4430 domain-containing protein [Streptococcus sp. NLN64]MBG9367167.1 DUF4430 domain-containing protein [Streptococcus sp. NLN64]